MPNHPASAPEPPPVARESDAVAARLRIRTGAERSRPGPLLARPAWLRRLSSVLSSFVVHFLVLLVLSLVSVFVRPADTRVLVVALPAAARPPMESLVPVEVERPPALSSSRVPAMDSPAPVVPELVDDFSGPPRVPSIDVRPRNLTAISLAPVGGGFEGRTDDQRLARLADGGGNAESEAAVAMGLEWLARHQRPDGGWWFNLEGTDCHQQCRDPGTAGTTTGSTGLALLPFLGAGFTHQDGPYREVVENGLYYLTGRLRMGPPGADLQEGTMYAQGIATVALCEAYAMTRDAALREPAQRAIDFICYAQHSKGGWRYVPGQPGDTTVFGWQLMALKSGRMAGLEVPSPVIELARQYLDSVQTGDGAFYGYLAPGKAPTPSAVGLLSRMYLGWPQDDPRLAAGSRYLAAGGPSRSDMYYNYYATQVLHHGRGPLWPGWNGRLRDYLVRTQATDGHERGSWHFEDKHAPTGGRLYTTAMCVMILEVYYRHMPLYGAGAVEDDL